MFKIYYLAGTGSEEHEEDIKPSQDWEAFTYYLPITNDKYGAGVMVSLSNEEAQIRSEPPRGAIPALLDAFPPYMICQQFVKLIFGAKPW